MDKEFFDQEYIEVVAVATFAECMMRDVFKGDEAERPPSGGIMQARGESVAVAAPIASVRLTNERALMEFVRDFAEKAANEIDEPILMVTFVAPAWMKTIDANALRAGMPQEESEQVISAQAVSMDGTLEVMSVSRILKSEDGSHYPELVTDNDGESHFYAPGVVHQWREFYRAIRIRGN